MQYLFQRVNRTPSPHKQTKNSLPCVCHIPIFEAERNVLWSLRVNRPRTPPTPSSNKNNKKERKKTKNHYPHIQIQLHISKFQNPMYYLPTKDLVFFRFIIFMYYPHIKTFNKIKIFSGLPYLIFPCNSKHICFFLGLIIVYRFLRRLTHASQNCQFQRTVATRT